MANLASQINLASGDEDVSITGAASGDHSSFSLAAGDVNGDGRSDLIVLSYWASPLGGTRIGEIDIIWGSSFPNDGDISLAQSTPAFARVYGSTTQAYSSIVNGGDFNNDGRFDIVWGQPFGPSPGFTSTDGVVYVVPGSSSFPSTLDIGSSPPQVITLLGGPWNGGLGAASCGCDLNGDQFDEVVVSAPWYMWADVFVIWGGTTFSSTYDMASPPAGVTTISDTRSNSGMGWALGCADFDADGFEDLVLGAPGLGPPNTYGTVTILFGRPEFPSTVALPDLAYRTKQIHKTPSIGGTVATGDFDGDGQIDLAASDPGADPLGCYNCGEAYLFLDPMQLPDSTLLDGANPVRLLGAGTNTWHGIRLRATDLNGDSRDELIVVSRGDPNSPSSIDETIVFYGSATLPDTVYLGMDTTVTRIAGPIHDADLGRGLVTADLNGDTIADLALGAHRVQGNVGKTYVIFGTNVLSAAGPAPPRLLVRQNYPNPFNPSTTITYTLPRPGRVRMNVFDVSGKLIATLVDAEQGPGDHVARWNGLDGNAQEAASGVYFCKLTVGDLSASMKLVLLR